jgi:mannose-6-phosphate isomerase-like protein (cupin superfamily)
MSLAETNTDKLSLADRLARYADTAEDTEAFQDVQDPANRRIIKYLVARHSDYAAVSTRNDLTVAILESMPGKGPKLHAHDYPEIFFCQEGEYGIVWGDHGEHCVTLNPFDTFAVPPGINRLVLNTGTTPGTMMVLFDTTRRDPNEGITMPAHVIAEERALGKDYVRRALDGVPMTPEQVSEYVALYADLAATGQDGAHLVRKIIVPGATDAGISHPHDLVTTLRESQPGQASDPATTEAEELLICLKGQLDMISGEERVTMLRFDTLPLPEGVSRHFVNSGTGPAIMLVVGKA